MVRRFVKVSEEEIEEVFFFPPSDLVNTKTTRLVHNFNILTDTLTIPSYVILGTLIFPHY